VLWWDTRNLAEPVEKCELTNGDKEKPKVMGACSLEWAQEARQRNSRSHLKAEKKMQLGRYMHWRKLPHRLRQTIRQHMIFIRRHEERYLLTRILEDLP